MGIGGVGPCVLEGPKACTAFLGGVYDVEQVAGAAREPIEPRDHEYISGFQLAEELSQLGPVAKRILNRSVTHASRLCIVRLPPNPTPRTQGFERIQPARSPAHFGVI